MKLDQVVYFLEVAKQGHLGRAAQILSLSPSAVSHSLSSLERDLGVQLFERNKKQLILTQRGRVLVERARPLISEFERLKEEVQSGEAPLVGHFLIGATHFLSGSFVAPAWSSVSASHARLSCDLISATSAQIVSRTSIGELDYAVCFSPYPNPLVEEEILHQGELGIAVRPDHPALKKKNKFWTELGNYPSVVPKAAQGIDNCESHPALELFKVKVRNQTTVDSYETIVGSIRNSDVWSLVPEIVAAMSGLAFVTGGTGWQTPYKISAIWPRNRMKTQLFVEIGENIQRGLRENLKKANFKKISIGATS